MSAVVLILLCLGSFCANSNRPALPPQRSQLCDEKHETRPVPVLS
jgi:hypothetical protein